MNIKIVQGIIIPSVGIILFLLGHSWVKGITVNFAEDGRINHLIKFQIYGLVLSILILGLTIWLAPESKKYLKFGDLSNLAQPIKVLGIKPNDNWYRTGGSFLIGITVVTALFMYMGLGNTTNWNNLLSLMPIVILFSLTNSFSEEIITRFSVVGLLDGHLKPHQIMWSAAMIFGLIHYFGNPGGPIGVLMAGFLGWILAKSLIETQGIGVAWTIHFVQDIVIYSFLLNSDVK